MNPQHSQHIPNPCPPALLPAPSGPPRAVSAVPAESPSIAHRIAHCTRSSSAFGEKTEPRPILPRIYSRIDCQRRPPAHLHGGGGALHFQPPALSTIRHQYLHLHASSPNPKFSSVSRSALPPNKLADKERLITYDLE